MATKDEILDAISNMTVLELSELLKDFEERFGVTAAAPVAVAGVAPAPGGAGDGGSEEAGISGAQEEIETIAHQPGVFVGDEIGANVGGPVAQLP